MLEPSDGLAAGISARFGHDFSQVFIQTKLAISEQGDKYEQEADRISERVMGLREPQPQGPCACGGVCTKCQTQQQPEHKHEHVHAKSVGSRDWNQIEAPPIVRAALRSPGQPLGLATRAFMEPRFGRDFSQVRVHADEIAERSARTINAHAYTVGNDIVFGDGRFDPNAAEGRRLIAHELTHVVQQSGGHAPRAVARQPADAGQLEQKDQPKTALKPAKCVTGCAQRWGQDTTCSKWGFRVGEREHAPHYVFSGGKGKTLKDLFTPCCNTWPWSVEDYARRQLGLNGAASCSAQHEKEVATVTLGEKRVDVLCSDTIPNDMVGETKSAGDCSGKINAEVMEMSPKAMQDLSGQVASALHVSVCFSGSKQDLCLHNGPGKGSFPEIQHCLTAGCTPEDGTPTLKETGWPRG